MKNEILKTISKEKIIDFFSAKIAKKYVSNVHLDIIYEYKFCLVSKTNTAYSIRPLMRLCN